MPLSRIRLRLAGWFALAFVTGLLVLSLTLFLYMRRQSEARFNRQLALTAGELLTAIRTEYAEAPDSGVAAAAAAALEEWPDHPEAFGVYDAAGRRLGVAGPAPLAQALPVKLPSNLATPTNLPGAAEHQIRVAAAPLDDPLFHVLAASTTEPLHEDQEAFALWLLASVPTTIILSLVAGYLLSRRALRPVGQLGQAIAGITPDALDQRLPVSSRPDELDRLAAQFNGLLERLERAQAQNRRFLEEAAHQIRTPLTLVLGETDLALDRPRSNEAHAEALRRIRIAAGQMRRRVEELLFLARAEAGERAPLDERVELDGLALECADLMRGRAHALGCKLELTRVDPAVVLGSEPLLREALLELLENACRHGSTNEPVRLSVLSQESEAVLEVINPAGGEESSEERGETSGTGLGLQVVQWIASEHGGRLIHGRARDRVTSSLHLPLAGATW
jgi:two-component system, OmpR family, heavy metal sensor histidine kinase CusS